jgi:eukaryotic-like serine/threonine-protein kinase
VSGQEPAQRSASARAVATDLGRYLDGEPILGRRLSRWQRLQRRARRHRALVILGAWSLAVILAIGARLAASWVIKGTPASIQTLICAGASSAIS